VSDRVLPLDLARATAERIPSLTYSLTSAATDIRVGLPTPQAKFGPSGFEVFFFSSTGSQSTRAPDGKGVDRPGAQCRVRAPRDKEFEGRILARQIAEAFNHKPPDGFLNTFVEGDGVNELGAGLAGEPEFSINFSALMARLPRQVYAGASASQPLTDAAIKSLDALGLLPFRFCSAAVSVAAGERIYLAYAADLGSTPLFFLNGVETAFTEISDSVTVDTQIGPYPYRVFEGPAGLSAAAYVVDIK